MQLATVRVTNFRSVEDSEEFSVDSVTCLVGKNEAGKSAILLALASLNPHSSTPVVLDKERDYPRRYLVQYDARHPDGDAVAVSTTWTLTSSEMSRLSDLIGKETCSSNIIIVSREYGEPIKIKADLNFKKALKFLYDKFALDASERAAVAAASTTSELITALGEVTSPSSRHLELKAHLAKVGHVTGQVESFVKSILPKFMYFSSYDRMDGAIQIEQAQQLIATKEISQDVNRGIRLFTEFLDYAGVSLDEITSVTTYETFNAKLQAASNNITDQILEYWTQNPDLSVVVRVEHGMPGDTPPLNAGTVARARIDNSLHRVDTPFSERSAGFVWFFSFLVKFAQVKKGKSPVILLLDEPGLTLHGKAQADLLRFFKEKLATHHQIIFTTHSPFMIPADNLPSVRIVEDQVEMKGLRRTPIGTKVRDDVLSRDPDTLFPLQGALGYEISQSLFVGKNTLLVEGPSDILYIHALSNALRKSRREGLDPRWTICPAGGIDKISPFVSLFGGNALNIAVLSDQGKGDKTKIENLKRSEVLKAGHFYTVADFLNRMEADIEDVLDPEIFISIVNESFSLPGAHKLSAKKLKTADATTERLVKQAEAAFKVMPDSIPMFDHFSPASWLIRNPKMLEADTQAVADTLDRAESIFKTFNQLLSPQ